LHNNINGDRFSPLLYTYDSQWCGAVPSPCLKRYHDGKGIAFSHLNWLDLPKKKNVKYKVHANHCGLRPAFKEKVTILHRGFLLSLRLQYGISFSR
jgi:hypothetical protein